MNALAYPDVSADARQMIEEGVICLLNEGARPIILAMWRRL